MTESGTDIFGYDEQNKRQSNGQDWSEDEFAFINEDLQDFTLKFPFVNKPSSISNEDDELINEDLQDITYEDIENYNNSMPNTNGYIDFKDLKPSTMTIVVFFNEKVNMAVAWHLIQIDYNSSFKRNGKKLAWPGCPGLILNCRYKLRQRGPCWKSSFKNSVNVDVSTSVKNISLKISEQSFQMCGASSLDDATEASLIVLQKLHFIYCNQVYIRQNFERYCEVYNYILHHAKGQPILKRTDKRLCQIVFKNSKQKKRKCSFITKEEILGHQLLTLPEICPSSLDPVIWDFLYSYHLDSLYLEGLYEEFMKKLSIIHTLPYIYKEATDSIFIEGNQLSTVNQIMVNYNYSFPKCIDREIFNYIASKLDCMNVFSRYYKDFNNNVSIEYVYNESEIDERIKMNKNKPIHQTSILYKSGSITASCRSIEEAVYMYNICKFCYCRYENLVVDHELTKSRKLKKNGGVLM